MIVESVAPTRVDVAGGTVDIWPLYLFHRHSLTLNFAIDVPARCRISGRADGRFALNSRDTGETAEFDSLDELWNSERLVLPAKLVHFFAPSSGVSVDTHCAAPTGSGLAGSSALNIALCAALNEFTGRRYCTEALIQIAKDVEAQVIRVPTGDQDYYPAAYGGVQAIHLSPGGVRRERIEVDADRLAGRFILLYSGRQRNSGINNWDVMKRHIDGDPGVFKAFEGIVEAAGRVREALLTNRFDLIEDALELEWANRRLLSDGINTPEMQEIAARARALGAGAEKVCGAGGGGCFVMTVPEGKRPEIESKLKSAGVRVMDYRIVQQGVQVSVIE
jgi:D-glycero-alpha-D-manno-heptose-7-phosphate kinase